MTTMRKLRMDYRVEHVDDERSIGNSLIVTMKEGWTLNPHDPFDGVFGEDTIAAAWAKLKTAVQIKDAM